MPNAMTIPILPCISLDATLSFYRSLGFEVTHQQVRPYVYVATQRGDIHLHFVGIPKLEPKNVYSACLVIVPELDRIYAAFREGLKSAYGKLPLQGFPRISRLRPGASRFTVVDVAGNSVVFIKRGAPDDYDEDAQAPHSDTPLGKALKQARRFRDFKNDDRAAAKVLDIVLRKEVTGLAIDRARALAARIEIALAQGDQPRANAARAELDGLPLTDEERERYRDELTAAERLERLRDE
jgi:catechol 2,3-dioxygenase-like lactoylglutathione lyase family enzyme